jgi:hypothetical protein
MLLRSPKAGPQAGIGATGDISPVSRPARLWLHLGASASTSARSRGTKHIQEKHHHERHYFDRTSDSSRHGP